MSYGLLCFIPVIVVIVVAVLTKKTLIALISGILAGLLIVDKWNFLWGAADAAVATAGNPDNMWLVVVCGLFGSLTLLIQKSGGAKAFGLFFGKLARGEKSSLLLTTLLGIFIFVDDYLNCLVLGSTMKKVTDRYKIAREYLAYVVDSTAGPICVLIPFSTWAVYSAGLIEKNGLAEAGQGISVYIQSLLFTLYPIVAILLVVLVVLGVFPKFAPLKKAYERAKSGGSLAPEGSASFAIVEIDEAEQGSGNLWNFIVPIAVMIAVTLIYNVDLLYGVVAGLVTAIIMYLPQKLMSFKEACDAIFMGFQSMLMPLMIIIAAFVLKDVNDQLGLTDFVIDAALPYMNKVMFPALTFIIVAALGLFTGANWGTWAITLPIVVPLAEVADVNMLLVLGAVWSGGAFGTHMCPWGDATVLSSAATGCDNLAHVKTQLPLALSGAVISIIIYILLGALM